jgi:hypothetical protein
LEWQLLPTKWRGLGTKMVTTKKWSLKLCFAPKILHYSQIHALSICQKLINYNYYLEDIMLFNYLLKVWDNSWFITEILY